MHFVGLKLFVSFVLFSVHRERLQSLSNNKCCMDLDKVKYMYIMYAFVGSKRLIMFVPCILDRQYIIIMHVCRHAF